MDNPFVTKGYAGPEYFCDRVVETKQLVELTTNGNNMALISPRRVGKTDLIFHCFQQPEIKDHYYTFRIDIYATNSLRGFVNVFGQSVMNALKPKGKVVWESFLSMLRSIRSQITFDINNMPVWSLGLGDIENPMVTLDEIFEYLSHADKPCMVAIDEFQQITRYADAPKVEALLRTNIQRCVNATFIFAGSKRHLMGEIFTSPSRPFYQSVLIMNLRPIPVEKYTEFARIQFSKYDKEIDDGVVDVEPIKDTNGTLTGLKQSSDADFKIRTEKQEEIKSELAAAGITGNSGSFELGDPNYRDNSPDVYTTFGISYDKTSDNWIYDGKIIHILYDADHNTYCDNSASDGINLKVIRDKNGNIEKLVKTEAQELEQYVK